MKLSTALERILREYPSASRVSFAQNPLASFIRDEFPRSIQDAIGPNERYLVVGGPGKGNWASVPWGAIFDRLVTASAQAGYYLVYLFRNDASGVYLSLNQGVTTVRKQYGSDARRALRVRAADYLARIGKVDPSLITKPIDLRTNAGLGLDYEQGSICSLFYEARDLPSDEVLYSDLRLLMEYYANLVARESALFDQSHLEDDETELGWEDLRMLRAHKRVERNGDLAARAKKKLGLTCQACGFVFANMYGEVGENYIEAHHLVPLAELRGKRVALDPARDFAVLCSNCHRMIHRSQHVSDVEMFRLAVLKK